MHSIPIAPGTVVLECNKGSVFLLVQQQPDPARGHAAPDRPLNVIAGPVWGFVAAVQVLMKWRDWSRGGWHIGCVDGLFDEIEYRRQEKALEWELESLLIPEVDSAKEAGRLLADMPRLWAGATVRERHQLLITTLDAIYIDMKDKKSVISMKAKPAFHAVLGVATVQVASCIAANSRLINRCPSMKWEGVNGASPIR